MRKKQRAVSIDTAKINKVIEQSGLKKKRIASELGITSVSFSQKLRGTVEFKVSEVYKLCKILDMPVDLMVEIFFTQKVD